MDAPGALHHNIIRGIERKAIFRDDRDRERFLERLESVLVETSMPCYAWALMKNHAHLLLRTGLAPVATVMRRLLTGYAQDFNRRYRRHGQLFQNRYKSILCEEDPYLLELVRYIHLNPLRAKAVFCYLAVKKLDERCASVAKALAVRPSAVSKAMRRGRSTAAESSAEQALVECPQVTDVPDLRESEFLSSHPNGLGLAKPSKNPAGSWPP